MWFSFWVKVQSTRRSHRYALGHVESRCVTLSHAASREVTVRHAESRGVTLRYVEASWVAPSFADFADFGKSMLQCPFCLKPFKNYHSLQRHTNRLSKTAADEGQLQWKLPRVEDITILPDRRQETADEPESKKQVGHINCTTATVLGVALLCTSVHGR